MSTADLLKYEYHWGYHVFSHIPVTGVLSCNSTEWVYEETDYRAVANLTYDSAYKYDHDEWLNEQRAIHGEDWEPSEDDTNEWEDDFNMGSEWSGETFLIGDWLKDDDGLWGAVHNGPNGYAAIVDYDTNNIQVIYSKWVTRSALCSPCYPGQCDLDSEGEYLAYDLPIEFYGEYRQNTNEQFEYIPLQPSLPFDGSPSDTPFVDEFIKSAMDKLNDDNGEPLP